MVLNKLNQNKQALLAKSIITNGIEVLINYGKNSLEYREITKYHLMLAKKLVTLPDEVVREIFIDANAKI